MKLTYADAIYSFRRATSFVASYVTQAPNAGTLATIESLLAAAASDYYARRYNDAITTYQRAGALIYRFLNPPMPPPPASIYPSLSKDAGLFSSLLSVAAEHMNVLPIPSPDPVQGRVQPDPRALGTPPFDMTGIKSAALTKPAQLSAAADMEAAQQYMASGQSALANFLEGRATQTDSATATVYKAALGLGADKPSAIAAVRDVAATAPAVAVGTDATIAPVRLEIAPTIPRIAATTRAPLAAIDFIPVTIPKTLPSPILEQRTLGVITNGQTVQVAWNAGDAPAIAQLQTAVYASRVTAATLADDILLFPRQASDVALALPHDYYYQIPLGIAEALHALGDYANAETQYLQAAAYQFLNQTIEAPYLVRRLASLYVDWGNSLFITGDAASALPVYSKLLQPTGAAPTTGMYALASLKPGADSARAVIASVANPSAIPATINPDLIGWIVQCHGQLVKIGAGLDYWGIATNNVPIWTFDYLQSVAVNFAQLAIGAEKDFITFQGNADQGSLTQTQLNQAVAQSQAEVNAAQAQADAASAEVAVYQAGVALAQQRATNAANLQANYAANSWQQISYQASSAQISGGDDGDPNYLNQLADQLMSGHTISGDQATVSAATQLTASRYSRDYQLAQLAATATEMAAAQAQAQAQLIASQAAATAAQAQVTVAQMRAQGAQAVLNQFDASFFTPDVWYAIGQNVYQLYQRYFTMALRVAKIMQQAYNFETDQSVRWIRASYATSEIKGLLGADALLADIQQFTYDLVTATKSKPQPLRHTISLATSFPFQFETQFRTTGVMNFETRVDDFDAAYPGTYAGRIQSAEVEIDGLVPVSGIAATLSNNGISAYRVPSAAWTSNPTDSGIKFRLQNKETLVISDYALRNDELLYTQQPQMLRIFEGAGVASSWTLEVPRSVNDIDFGALTDVRITFYYVARYDDSLKTRVLAHLAALPGVTRRSRSVPLRWVYPDAFYSFLSTGTLRFTLRARDFGYNESQPKIHNIGVLVATDRTKPASGINLSVTAPGHAAVAATTDANGVAASATGNALAALAGNPAVGDYALALTAAQNPGLVTGGKLNLTPIVNVTLLLEYDFTVRT